MFDKLRFTIARLCGKTALFGVKFSSGMGKSLPGNVFLRVGSYNSLKKLASNPKFGNILITGTNGKTTSTKIIIELLNKEYNISYNYESNTVNAIATGLLKSNVDFGVFEYGIRDVTHGIPDFICENVNPLGVVYTNVSREHTQVLGVKNSFEMYLHAKSLLSKCMKRGVIVANADNVNTAFIGLNKEKDVNVNYFGLDLANVNNSNDSLDVNCPQCSKIINFEKVYMSNSGVYNCECGFKRPTPNVKITEIDFAPDKWTFKIEGNPYNYFLKKAFKVNIKCTFPPLGIYNLYNALGAITTYLTFTSNVNGVEEVINSVFNNLDSSILPPGRFQIFDLGNKFVGMGQGDNGIALNANTEFIKFSMDNDSRENLTVEYIYTTPEENEEEIFEDHLVSIKSLNPSKVYVIPGRDSIEVAEDCYNVIKKDFPSEFFPISFEDIDKRIEKVAELVNNSNADYIIASGCGEESLFWESVKNKFKE